MVDELIKDITEIDTFDPTSPIEPVISKKFKEEILERLAQLPQHDPQSKQQMKYIESLKIKIKYLEDFVVRLARESQKK